MLVLIVSLMVPAIVLTRDKNAPTTNDEGFLVTKSGQQVQTMSTAQGARRRNTCFYVVVFDRGHLTAARGRNTDESARGEDIYLAAVRHRWGKWHVTVQRPITNC